MISIPKSFKWSRMPSLLSLLSMSSGMPSPYLYSLLPEFGCRVVVEGGWVVGSKSPELSESPEPSDSPDPPKKIDC